MAAWLIPLIESAGMILPAILVFIGLLFKNDFMAFAGGIIFLFFIAKSIAIPPFIWIIIIIGIAFMILRKK